TAAVAGRPAAPRGRRVDAVRQQPRVAVAVAATRGSARRARARARGGRLLRGGRGGLEHGAAHRRGVHNPGGRRAGGVPSGGGALPAAAAHPADAPDAGQVPGHRRDHRHGPDPHAAGGQREPGQPVHRRPAGQLRRLAGRAGNHGDFRHAPDGVSADAPCHGQARAWPPGQGRGVQGRRGRRQPHGRVAGPAAGPRRPQAVDGRGQPPRRRQRHAGGGRVRRRGGAHAPHARARAAVHLGRRRVRRRVARGPQTPRVDVHPGARHLPALGHHRPDAVGDHGHGLQDAAGGHLLPPVLRGPGAGQPHRAAAVPPPRLPARRCECRRVHAGHAAGHGHRHRRAPLVPAELARRPDHHGRARLAVRRHSDLHRPGQSAGRGVWLARVPQLWPPAQGRVLCRVLRRRRRHGADWQVGV
ncbi:hypothetical protein GGI15_003017, partial [Coemansia interrupta]